MLVSRGREHFPEHRESRGHGNGVRVVRAAVENFMLRDETHHFPRGRECSQREAAADRFCQTNDIRLNSEIFASPTAGQLRSGFNFIENQQSAILSGNFAQRLVIAFVRHQDPDIHHDRLDDDRRDFARILCKEALDAGHIVELRNQSVLQRSFRYALAARHGIREVCVTYFLGFRFYRDENGIVQSVIAALHLDDAVASGGRARQAHGMHGAFRSTVAEPHHLHRKSFADFFGQFPFEIVRHSEHGSGA